MAHKYIIRQAVQEDCEDLHKLITELAAFENGGDQVRNTVEGLREDGFGKHAFFKCLVAERSGLDGDSASNAHNKVKEVIGYALYFFGYSTWNGKLVYLEDLYVTPEHRGAGIGTAMMKRVAKIGAEAGCRRMQWVVLGWNTGARELYDTLGAQNLTDTEDWHILTLRNEGFADFVSEETNSNNMILIA